MEERGAPSPVRVVVETERGSIELEVDAARAPVTGANFLRYVDEGYYNGGRFHRSVTMDNQPDNDVKIEVIQASINPERVADAYPPILLERTSSTGLAHTDGTVSMARRAPDAANYYFFICIGDQPELNYEGRRNPDGQGFAAFGRVSSGMDVVHAIQRLPVEGQKLNPPVLILRAHRR